MQLKNWIKNWLSFANLFRFTVQLDAAQIEGSEALRSI